MPIIQSKMSIFTTCTYTSRRNNFDTPLYLATVGSEFVQFNLVLHAIENIYGLASANIHIPNER